MSAVVGHGHGVGRGRHSRHGFHPSAGHGDFRRPGALGGDAEGDVGHGDGQFAVGIGEADESPTAALEAGDVLQRLHELRAVYGKHIGLIGIAPGHWEPSVRWAVSPPSAPVRSNSVAVLVTADEAGSVLESALERVSVLRLRHPGHHLLATDGASLSLPVQAQPANLGRDIDGVHRPVPLRLSTAAMASCRGMFPLRWGGDECKELPARRGDPGGGTGHCHQRELVRGWVNHNEPPSFKVLQHLQ